MRKVTPYISALIYAVLLTIILFNATATSTLNWNAINSELGLNNFDVNGVNYDVALVVDLVTSRGEMLLTKTTRTAQTNHEV